MYDIIAYFSESFSPRLRIKKGINVGARGGQFKNFGTLIFISKTRI